MKSYIRFIITLLTAFAVSTSVNAQMRNWPSALNYELQGNIKSWVMKNESGEILREMEFNPAGEIIKGAPDKSHTDDSYVPPEYLPAKLKVEFEKSFKGMVVPKDSATKMKWNDNMQLLEKKNKNYYESNTFTDDGKILVHKTTQTTTQIAYWNSTHHAEPSYTYESTFSFLAIYKYNKAGKLIDFQYFHSDPFKNVRMVYTYDSLNNLIESNRYDNYNIHSGFIKDDYLDKFLNTKIDESFSIDKYFEDYWGQGQPVKETWSYNAESKPIEYVAYGYQNGPSFRAIWNYDANGQLTEEIQFDVYHDTKRSIITYDAKKNVIRETDFDYWAKKEYRYTFEIVYYQ